MSREHSPADEASFFDGLVAAEGDFDPFTEAGWATLRARFRSMIGSESPLRVLDIGCGTGRSLTIYAASARLYVGADLSLVALREARRRLPVQRWLRANGCALPFPSGAFDLVAFSSVLHHIPRYGDALREAWRVLAPGGRVFAFDPNLLNPAMALLRHPASPLYQPAGVSPGERPLHPRALRSAFASAGFTAIRQRGQSAIAYRSTAVGFVNRLLPLYNRADALLEAAGLGRWIGTFVVTVGEKP